MLRRSYGAVSPLRLPEGRVPLSDGRLGYSQVPLGLLTRFVMGLELGRHGDLDDFPVIRILQHFVPNTRRLIPGVAGCDPDLAYILEVESRPTLDQINHLKIQVMRVVTHRAFTGLVGTNDLSQNSSFGGLLDAQIAIPEIGSQPLFDRMPLG